MIDETGPEAFSAETCIYEMAARSTSNFTSTSSGPDPTSDTTLCGRDLGRRGDATAFD